jgi:hypothetical protein
MEIVKFDTLDDSWARLGGLCTRCIFMGPKNNPDSPIGVAIRAERDVGDLVAGKRSFGTTTAMTVLSGSVMHDGRWMVQGEMYISPPDEPNGDLLFGPEGAVIFLMFDKRSGMVPRFSNPGDQANFDNLLRADVEAVASGVREQSVSILPLRTEFTKDRAIVYTTHDQVAKYRQRTGTDW